MNKRLIIVDGHAILHRAFHALPALTAPGGQPTGAIYGFFKMVFRLWQDFDPGYFLVAFDTPGPNFRHQKFVGYQAKRPKVNKELASQIDLLGQILTKARIAHKRKPGFEADDIIGTVARRLEKKLSVLIVTGDRDLMQLVDEKVNLFLPQNGLSTGRIVDSRYVKEDLGIRPDQVVDYKGLVGDNSDNYPGALGIGPKTGVKLLNRFGSLAGIYRHLDEIDSALVRERLIKYQDDVFLSADLAKINCRIPIKIKPENYRVDKIVVSELKSSFRALGFRSLLRDLEKKTEQIGLF